MTRVGSKLTEFYSPPPEELSEEKEILEELLEEETPSLDQGLVDLRQKFTEEEERRRDIESKAAGILAVSGLLLALLRFIYREFVGGSVLILLAFVVLLSILLSLANLVPVGYMAPRRDSILTYTSEETDEYTKQMYKKYHIANFNNREVNESRLRVLRWSYYPIVIVVLLLAGILIVIPSVEIAQENILFLI